MKIFTLLFLLFFFLLTGQAQDAKINWMTWNEMIAQREKDEVKKKIFIDFYTGWCGWCKRMDATTFADPNVVNYMNENYYAVKFDAETMDTIMFNGHTFTNSQPQLVKSSPGARGAAHWFAHSILEGKLSYPSYTILDENFTRLVIYAGYKSVEDLLGILLFFKTENYKIYHNYLNEMWNKSLKTNN